MYYLFWSANRTPNCSLLLSSVAILQVVISAACPAGAVDQALVVDVLPGHHSAAKDLSVFNIAGALPFSIASAIAPAILAIGSGSYGVLYAVAGLCAIIGAFTILPVKRVR